MNAGVEFARLWEPGVPGIELFSAQLVSHTFGKHFHEAYTIGMNDAGLGQFMYQGTCHDAAPGRFNLINPGAVHTGQVASDGGWRFRNIYISVPFVEQLLTQLEWSNRGLPYFLSPTVWDQLLQSSFSHLFHALNTSSPQLELQFRLLDALAHLFCRYAEPYYSLRSPASESHAVSVVRAYLEAHYAENISIETLAKLVNLSPYYLIRSFRQQVGLPPHSYQQHWQLLQAKRSLRTCKPLADVATEHGFYDQSHLNRIFKRAFGITPGQYRGNFIQDGSA